MSDVKYIFNDAAAFADFIGRFDGVCLLADEHTAQLLAHPSSPAAAAIARALASAHKFTAPAGEAAKSWRVLEEFCEFLCARPLSRRSLIVNFGGGVISDLGGLAAALFKRGCAHANVPTTLLAAADAGIGGKTAINARGGKNLIGVFKNPERVFVFSDLFASLSAEALACGWAEIIKMALVFDPQAAEQIERGQLAEADAIALAATIKRGVVERDWLECAERALLNYGHTFAHAIEHESRFALPHGQAVAAGMAMADELARELGILSEAPARLGGILRRYGCCERYVIRDLPGFVACMRRDKKNIAGGGGAGETLPWTASASLCGRLGFLDTFGGVSATTDSVADSAANSLNVAGADNSSGRPQKTDASGGVSESHQPHSKLVSAKLSRGEFAGCEEKSRVDRPCEVIERDFSETPAKSPARASGNETQTPIRFVLRCDAPADFPHAHAVIRSDVSDETLLKVLRRFT